MYAFDAREIIDEDESRKLLSVTREEVAEECRRLVELIRENNYLLLTAEFALSAFIHRSGQEPRIMPRVIAYFMHLVENNYLNETLNIAHCGSEVIEEAASLLYNLPMRAVVATTPGFNLASCNPWTRITSVQKMQDVFITGRGYYKHKKEIFSEITDSLKKKYPSLLCGREIYRFFDEVINLLSERIKLSLKQMHDFYLLNDRGDGFDEKCAAFIQNTILPSFEISSLKENYPKIFDLFTFDMNVINASKAVYELPLCGKSYSSHPIWKVKEKYYLFNFVEFEDNLYSLYADILKRNGQCYFEDLRDAKADFLEQRGAELLYNALAGDVLLRNVKYRYNNEEYETDALVGVGEILYVIEAKSTKFRPAALKGAKLSLEKQMKESFSFADKQASRFIQHLNEAGSLEVKAGAKVSQINVENFCRIEKIVVTYEDMSPHLASVKNLLEANLLQKEGMPWVVTLHDLMAIAEVLKDAHEFHLYMIFRSSINQREDIVFHDEMEILGYFLKEGCRLPARTGMRYQMTQYSREIDAYFVENGVLPRFITPKYVSSLCQAVMKTRSLCRVRFVVTLLIQDENDIRLIESMLRANARKVLRGYEDTNILEFRDLNIAFCYLLDAEDKIRNSEAVDSFMNRLLQTVPKKNNFYVVFLEGDASCSVKGMLDVNAYQRKLKGDAGQ